MAELSLTKALPDAEGTSAAVCEGADSTQSPHPSIRKKLQTFFSLFFPRQRVIICPNLQIKGPPLLRARFPRIVARLVLGFLRTLEITDADAALHVPAQKPTQFSIRQVFNSSAHAAPPDRPIHLAELRSL